MKTRPNNKEENIAAIAYGMAGLTNKAGLTFYEQHGDELEGEGGCLRYFVECADAFTTMGPEGAPEYDWYLAVDAYVADIVECADLPDYVELQLLARKAIVASREFARDDAC